MELMVLFVGISVVQFCVHVYQHFKFIVKFKNKATQNKTFSGYNMLYMYFI